MIAVEPDDWKTYDKLAKALSKQVGFKMYINNTVKVAVVEYLDNHPELGVRVIQSKVK